MPVYTSRTQFDRTQMEALWIYHHLEGNSFYMGHSREKSEYKMILEPAELVRLMKQVKTISYWDLIMWAEKQGLDIRNGGRD